MIIIKICDNPKGISCNVKIVETQSQSRTAEDGGDEMYIITYSKLICIKQISAKK